MLQLVAGSTQPPAMSVEDNRKAGSGTTRQQLRKNPPANQTGLTRLLRYHGVFCLYASSTAMDAMAMFKNESINFDSMAT